MTPDQADDGNRGGLLRQRWFKITAGAVVLLAVAGGVFLWWFFKDDAPAPVDLDAAAEGVTDTTASDAPSDSTAGGSVDGEITGAWSVDTSIGSFDFEEATGSFVGFRIEEELARIGSTTAVGRTGAVSGTIEIDGTTLTGAEFEVDLTQITTNESRRDDKVQEALETGEFPSATFVLTEPVELPDGATDGESISVDVTGDLTIHGVTNEVTFAMDARVVDDVIVVVGSTEVVFADYGVAVPSAPVVLSVEDNGILELQLLFTQS